MRIKKFDYYVGDFETTVYKGQVHTEVWAAALVKMYTDDVLIFHSIYELFEYLSQLKGNQIVYFHNLKFDGSFWLPFLINDLKYEQAYLKVKDKYSWLRDSLMNNKTFKYSISNMGQWYNIIIKVNNKYIEIRDSLKLLPFSVDKISKDFNTKHKKLEMEYKGFRYAGCNITDGEKIYISSDVLVVKEALEIMFSEGHNKLTIGGCCLSEFKKMCSDFEKIFPNLYNSNCIFGNVGEFIHASYHGGWCYLNPHKTTKLLYNGATADVNSLYPSMMHSESGNFYPIGEPTFWKGNYIPKICTEKYFFIRVKTRFYLKAGKLPFIQIKNSPLFPSNKMLTTSDIWDYETQQYYPNYTINGEEKQAIHEMTLTMTDYKLFLEHYSVKDFEIIGGCYFDKEIGIFDAYIDHYREIKMREKGAKKQLAKLFLNNLYGKMAASPDSSFKVAYLKDDKTLSFLDQREREKKPGYIPIGSAITSYARNFTIRAAQANYNGDKPGFVYADTDSIHCDIPKENIKGITIDDNAFCCWKIENEWDTGWFVRQKTYIEVEGKNYIIKCAGMPDRCKDLFLENITGEIKIKNKTQEQVDFLKTKRNITDFKIGIEIPGKLFPKRLRGGVVLTDTTYKMR